MAYRVYVKNTAKSAWRDVGVVETNKDTAEKVWAQIIRDLRRYAFKLVPF